jgi:EAL domain-containing protein (putative c-di-GMP-specific phosphodiesterase class I)
VCLPSLATGDMRLPMTGSNIETDPQDAALVNAIITLAHSLGLRVIAEGVENEAQLEFLRECGCDEVQGFLLARPAPLDEITLST